MDKQQRIRTIVGTWPASSPPRTTQVLSLHNPAHFDWFIPWTYPIRLFPAAAQVAVISGQPRNACLDLIVSL